MLRVKGIENESSVSVASKTRVSVGVEIAAQLMLNEFVNAGKLSPNKYVKLTSWNPTHVFQVYPQKGAIQVGSDADLTCVDIDVTHFSSSVTACAITRPFLSARVWTAVTRNASPSLLKIEGMCTSRLSHARMPGLCFRGRAV